MRILHIDLEDVQIGHVNIYDLFKLVVLQDNQLVPLDQYHVDRRGELAGLNPLRIQNLVLLLDFDGEHLLVAFSEKLFLEHCIPHPEVLPPHDNDLQVILYVKPKMQKIGDFHLKAGQQLGFFIIPQNYQGLADENLLVFLLVRFNANAAILHLKI